MQPPFNASPNPLPLVLTFASAATAEHVVAGVPLAARVLREVALGLGEAGASTQCHVIVPGGWIPGLRCRAEIARLAPGLDWMLAGDRTSQVGTTLNLCGEALVPGEAIAAALSGPWRPVSGICRELPEALALSRELSSPAHLTALERDLIAGTGKPADGLVSRYFNRPISQAISRVLLRVPGITPMHATFGTAGLGLAMAACLFTGTEPGLIAGALLFQAASVWDGVDGEIARASFQTSARGAMLDSLIDAATNLAFIAGLTFNLWQREETDAALAGLAGLAMLATGLTLLGARSRTNGGHFTFDAVKTHFRKRPSRLMRALSFIAMRDFFAAAYAVLIVIGLAPHALIAFSTVTAGWLAVTIAVLFRTRKAGKVPSSC